MATKPLHKLRAVFGRGSAALSVVTPSAAPPVMPQADLSDGCAVTLAARDWRSYFSSQLSGDGLEIGPLHRPMLTHDRMRVRYVDRCSVAELRAHYPELRDLPLVEPDIISDAETLAGVADRSFDFLVAAHVLEHMRNPLGALKQWCRVVKSGGFLYLIVPDKRAIFDKHRVRTLLEHMILDYERPSAERDFEHYLEYAVHVHGLAGFEALREAERLLSINYSIHYHTFVPGDVMGLLAWFSREVRALTVLEGPCMAAGADEFHLKVRVDG